MFATKKKTKDKDNSSGKDSGKKLTRNISKQLKNLMGRKKTSDTDNASQITSVDSNTGSSIRSSVAEPSAMENCVIASFNNESDNDSYEKDIRYPIWYKQTLILPRCERLNFETTISLKISRTTQGDFGFVLRKGHSVERFTDDDVNFKETKDLSIFAEPVNMNRDNLLLPGDKLVEVGSTGIHGRSREEVIELIKSCGSVVLMAIQPASECLEFSFRRFTNLFFNHVNIRSWLKEKKGFNGIYTEYYNKVKNNAEPIKCVDSITKEKVEERVWINFNEGFAAGMVVKKLENGKCLIRLSDDNSEIEVAEEDIHPANSSKYDMEENLVLLLHLNESTLLHNIRQRFSKNLIHTYIGKHVLYVNPMTTLNCFSEKVMHLFKNASPEDIPPHIYATAQNTFQNLKSTKENQSICILGRSGSGKSIVLKHLVSYFSCVTSVYNKCNISDDKLKALWILLDAFTCTRTNVNMNSSRCGKRITLNFSHVNHNIVLMGLHLQIFLLDKNRLFRRPEREPTYHIFYSFMAGIRSKQIHEYNLEFMNEPNAYMTPLQRESEKQLALEQWEVLCAAASILGIPESEWNVICRILAAIIHLGAAKSINNNQNGRSFATFLNRVAAKRAANTLNCSEEALHRAIFEYYKDDNDNDLQKKGCGMSYSAQDLLDGFVGGLYYEVVEIIVYFINRYFNTSYSRIINSIIIVDPPGFQVFSSCGDKSNGRYEDLLYNYAYERLLNLNYTHNLTKMKDMYIKEKITSDIADDDTDIYCPILKLLDGDCNVDAFDTIGKKGLLNFIESEAFVGNDKSLMKKLSEFFESHHKAVPDKKLRILKQLCTKTGDFTINHCNRSQTLKYNINDGLKYSRELPTFSSSEVLLSMCHNDTIQDLLTSLSKSQSEVLNSKYSNKSVLANCKLEMNNIISCLTQTSHLSFIYCIAPIPNSGLCQLKESINKQSFDENIACGGLFSVPLVKVQLQSFLILQIIRSIKFGYPEHLSYDKFSYLIRNIVPPNEFPSSETLDENSILKLLDYLRMNRKRYKIGISKIFFRLGTIFDLKNSKEWASQNFIIKFQSVCRKYLAIKKVEKLRLQTEAIRIIQKNASVYLKIKEWPWWKLYSRLRPLINVLRIDDLKSVNEEVSLLKLKNQELENERDQLKKDKRQMENSLYDMENEQIVCRQKIQKLTSVLEDKETNEMHLTQKIEDLKEEMVENVNKIWKLEKELKITQPDEVDHISYEINKSENQMASDNFQDLEIEKLLKESNNQKEVLEVELIKTKKICDNLKLELEDFKYQVDHVTSEESEQKLYVFEKEIKRLQNLLIEETASREKLLREKDIISSEKLLLEKQLKESKLENSRKIPDNLYDSHDFVNLELDEKDYAFKRMKTELTQRIKELEEEIDEVNDNFDISQKDNMKLKLQVEKLNSDKINELNEKDEEIEHIKVSNAKKLKNIELQLEEDHLKRQSLMKDKRDADRQVLELKQKLEAQCDTSMEKRLRKELKTSKELLNNALDQIEELKCRKENKSELKDLRDKLDDAEHLNEKLLKQKNNFERELEESTLELETATKTRDELEKKLKLMKSDLLASQGHSEDMENQNEHLERKIKQLQSQIISINNANTSFQERVDSLEDENKKLLMKSERLEQELNAHNVDQSEKLEITRLQNKIAELEMKLHFEDSAKTRFQTMNEKLKEQLYDIQVDKETILSKESSDRERIRKLEKQLKDARDNEDNQNKEILELKSKNKVLVDKNSEMEEEVDRKGHELNLAKQKIQRLEQTIDNDDDDDSDHSFSEVLNKADRMIKTRKLSLDQNSFSSNPDHIHRRYSVATERLSTHFSDVDDDDEY